MFVYKQFVDLILGRARSTNKKYKDTALPSIADGDFELYQLNAKNNDNSEIGKITSSRMLTDYYYIPNEILYQIKLVILLLKNFGFLTILVRLFIII